jgi:hypothetical protein
MRKVPVFSILVELKGSSLDGSTKHGMRDTTVIYRIFQFGMNRIRVIPCLMHEDPLMPVMNPAEEDVA